MVDIKPKVYPCFFCVSLFIVVIGTNLVLLVIGKLGEISGDQVGLMYLIYVLPITAPLTLISIIIANIITKRSVREVLPKYSKNSLSKQKSLLKQKEMRSSLPEIWYLKEDNKIQRLKKEKLEKERKRLEVEKRGMEKRYKRERPIIEKLIQEMKFSDAVLKLKDIKNASKKYNLSEINSWAIKKLDKLEREEVKIEKIDIIKKTVLELGIKFARLQIAEISEVCDVDDVQLIEDIVKDMIDNKEIYAQYFSSTKAVAFDQQANIDEIDKLMSTYKDWEENKIGKK